MAYVHQEYPKWLRFEGEPAILVRDLASEEAERAKRAAPLAEGDAPKRRGRPPKADDAP